MPASWKTIFSRAEPRFGPGATPLRIVRNARARALRLRVDPRDGSIRLTVPARASVTAARAWAERQRDWIEAQLAAIPAAGVFAPGATIPFRGGTLLLVHVPGRRGARLSGDPAMSAGARLELGGPDEMFAATAMRWLRREALRVLDADTRALAASIPVAIGRVGVGDPRSRWGSCSANGDIRYSWRLILAPDPVRRSVVAHEVAHRLHMDHGPAFRALEAQLAGPDLSAGRDWLRRHGATLHRWGALGRA
jgi:predicted metal-dependent hydrolase